MRVVLSTIGKFHAFDLARQMHRRGALASIFSGYPWFKLKGEGLPKKSVKTFPFLHAPYMKLAPRRRLARWLWEWQDRLWFDLYVAGSVPPCDVFWGMSGSGLYSSKAAKTKGAKYICDRGSSHVRVQNRILREEYDRQSISFNGFDARIMDREVAEYQDADAITVPSAFAFNSFIEAGVPSEKMRVAPYGVDLHSFYPCAPRNEKEFRVLFVGSLCVRKGVSYLLKAFQELQCGRKQLTLVGAINPELEPVLSRSRSDARIRVAGAVPQSRLKEIMSASHVLVLPSVEEGLALVQAQAMACGCPVIATENTGARDLFTDGIEGFIVPIRDANAIAEKLQLLADDPQLRSRMGEAALQCVRSMGGWEQYGERMYQIFSELLES
jgi:glycosyltransferase involved in cell wall biosynthesis